MNYSLFFLIFSNVDPDSDLLNEWCAGWGNLYHLKDLNDHCLAELCITGYHGNV